MSMLDFRTCSYVILYLSLPNSTPTVLWRCEECPSACGTTILEWYLTPNGGIITVKNTKSAEHPHPIKCMG